MASSSASIPLMQKPPSLPPPPPAAAATPATQYQHAVATSAEEKEESADAQWAMWTVNSIQQMHDSYLDETKCSHGEIRAEIEEVKLALRDQAESANDIRTSDIVLLVSSGLICIGILLLYVRIEEKKDMMARLVDACKNSPA